MPTDVRFHAVSPAGDATDRGAAPVDDAAWRDGLLEAFWRYERALLDDDLDVLDELFLDDPATLRADAAGVLVGHAEIGAFRRARAAVGALPGPRTVERLHVQVHGPGCAVVVAQIARADGGRGLQTQVWVALPALAGAGADAATAGQSRWRVAAAHVSGSPPAVPAAGAADTGGTSAVWRVRGEPLVVGTGDGPLRGLTVAVKDLFAVAGHRAGAGNPAWLAEAAPAAEHAPAVAALLAAGADVAGIAQTDELAYSLSGTNVHYGTPPNPAAPGAIPGGSSSGPASAVALGQADIGLGTDTGGSVRVPASYCGLFGIRPTHGAVSATGVVPLAPSFDTVGWLTRDADTLARVGAVLLAPADPALPAPTSLLVADDLAALAEPDTAGVLAGAVRALAVGLGLPVRRVPSLAGGRLADWLLAFRHGQGCEAHQTHGAWVAAHPGALGPGIAGRFAAAAAVADEQLATARAVRAEVRATLGAALGGGAVLVIPAASGPAPAIDLAVDAKDRLRAETLTLTSAAGLAGLPVVVLPAGRVGGRPVGLAMVGAAGMDHALLALARRAAARA